MLTFPCNTEVGTSWMQARARGTGGRSMILGARLGARTVRARGTGGRFMILGAHLPIVFCDFFVLRFVFYD